MASPPSRFAFRDRHRLLASAVATLAAWAGLWLYLSHQNTQETRLAVERNIEALSVAYRSVIDMHRLDVRTRLRYQLLGPRQLELLRAMRDARPAELPALRQALRQSLTEAYRELERQGIEQVQFLAPDCTSLLRLHAPDASGDDLHGLRPGLCRTSTQHQVAAGFEDGRFGAAYRHVFPIIDHGQFLGSIEISLPFRRIGAELAELLGPRDFLLLLPRTVTGTPPSPDASFAPAYRAVGSEPLPAVITTALQDDRPRLQARMARGDAFSVPVLDGREGHAASFLAVPLLGETGHAYLVAAARDPSLWPLRRGFIVQFALLSLLLLLAAGLLLRLLRQGLALRRQLDQLEAITQSMGEGLYVMDADGRILLVNEAACQILGYPRQALLGQQAHTLFHSHHGNRHLPLLQCPIYRTAQEHSSFVGEEVFLDHQGREIPVQVHSRALREHGQVVGSVTIFSDISERKAQERQIEQLAFHDVLTGLPNRRLFDTLLAEAVSTRPQDSQLAVMFIDLDHFKPVNDRYGHDAGDHLLQQVAARMLDCIGEDAACARTGGDEFVVLLRRLHTPAQAQQVGERLLQHLNQPFQLGHDEVSISASIGIALYPLHAGDIEHLLKSADSAMYHAKASGRGQVQMYAPGQGD